MILKMSPDLLKKKTTLDSCVGEKLCDFFASDDDKMLTLVFEAHFVVLKADPLPSDYVNEPIIRDVIFDFRDHAEEDLIDSGIVDARELELVKNNHEQAKKDADKVRRFAQYEALKKEFERE
jgi:hypothetical protein